MLNIVPVPQTMAEALALASDVDEQEKINVASGEDAMVVEETNG